MLTPLFFKLKLDIFKTPKHLCATPKHLTEIKYVPHGDETRIVGLFSMRTDIFGKTKG
jgi:hypothetical protein